MILTISMCCMIFRVCFHSAKQIKSSYRKNSIEKKISTHGINKLQNGNVMTIFQNCTLLLTIILCCNFLTTI